MRGRELAEGERGPLQQTVECAREEHLPEVLALTARCPDAPHWPSSAWQAFLEPGVEGRCKMLLIARGGDGELLGWLAANSVFETAELEFVLVHPEARGRGIGWELVSAWLQRAAEAGAREALLEVRASNRTAQALYAGLGFEVQGLRRGYYEQPREDAVLMRRVLPVGEVFPQAAQSSPSETGQV